jgi:ATP-dependent Clp protease ATP-binding subunit ClpA
MTAVVIRQRSRWRDHKDLTMASSEPAREDIFLPGGQICTDCISEPAHQVLREALKLARATRWDNVRSPHIFMGLLAVPDPGVRAWGELLSADLDRMLSEFQELFHQEKGEKEALLVLHREFLSDNFIRILREAYGRAKDYRRVAITPMDLLVTLLTASDSVVAECFERIGVTPAKLTDLALLAEQQTAES